MLDRAGDRPGDRTEAMISAERLSSMAWMRMILCIGMARIALGYAQRIVVTLGRRLRGCQIAAIGRKAPAPLPPSSTGPTVD